MTVGESWSTYSPAMFVMSSRYLYSMVLVHDSLPTCWSIHIHACLHVCMYVCLLAHSQSCLPHTTQTSMHRDKNICIITEMLIKSWLNILPAVCKYYSSIRYDPDCTEKANCTFGTILREFRHDVCDLSMICVTSFHLRPL